MILAESHRALRMMYHVEIIPAIVGDTILLLQLVLREDVGYALRHVPALHPPQIT